MKDCEPTVAGSTLFLQYVDNLWTVKVDPNVVLQAAKTLYPNKQFTVELLDENYILVFQT